MSNNQVKTLYRSEENKMIAGVCQGFAERYGWDVTILRVVTAVLAVVSSGIPVVLIYFILWIVLPEKKDVVIGEYELDPDDYEVEKEDFFYE